MVAACRAFVAVSGHGSFTSGATAAGIPQSVASRRIAALEEHFGARLFDRSSRAVRLTPFGQDMLRTARRLVDLADAMTEDAERARLRPLRIAVPDSCPPHRLATLVAAGRRQQTQLEVRPADPAGREQLCRTLEVSAGIVAVPAEAAVWRVPLGLASRTAFPARMVFLETLRAGRTGAARGGGGGPRRRAVVRGRRVDRLPRTRRRAAGSEATMAHVARVLHGYLRTGAPPWWG